MVIEILQNIFQRCKSQPPWVFIKISKSTVIQFVNFSSITLLHCIVHDSLTVIPPYCTIQDTKYHAITELLANVQGFHAIANIVGLKISS